MTPTQHQTATTVMHYASRYRHYRQLASDARSFGDTLPACRFAARAGIALRAMRRAAREHNREAK